MRAICRRAGLTVRYFYESFTDKDDFVGAVYDWVIADIAASTQAAVAAAPPREQSRAAMANIVRTIVEVNADGPTAFQLAILQPDDRSQARGGGSTLMAMLSFQHVGKFGVRERAGSRRRRTSSSAASRRSSAPGCAGDVAARAPKSWSTSSR